MSRPFLFLILAAVLLLLKPKVAPELFGLPLVGNSVEVATAAD